MPMKKELYPANWNEISRRIRERDNQRCTRCGVLNNVYIRRSKADPARYLIVGGYGMYETPDGGMVLQSELPDEFSVNRPIRVILTVHHIGIPKPDGSPGSRFDKMDCRPRNLVSLCQRCHFISERSTYSEQPLLI